MPALKSTFEPSYLKVNEMLRLEGEPRPYSHKGGALRAMLTPNEHLWFAASSQRSRISKRATKDGHEVLVKLTDPWDGKDYVILNVVDGTFRAWPRSFHRPRTTRLRPQSDLLEEILASPLPERDSSTALIRLSLGPTAKIRGRSWIDLGELPYRWPDRWSRNGLILPQAYVHSVIQHLGSLCGLAIAELDDGRLEVTWNGNVFAMREIIRPGDWIAE